jgi:hypothetical protein
MDYEIWQKSSGQSVRRLRCERSKTLPPGPCCSVVTVFSINEHRPKRFHNNRPRGRHDKRYHPVLVAPCTRCMKWTHFMCAYVCVCIRKHVSTSKVFKQIHFIRRFSDCLSPLLRGLTYCLQAVLHPSHDLVGNSFNDICYKIIIRMIKSLRMRWAGHLSEWGEE